MARGLKARRNRPLFLIDIGVPRNVEPEVHRLDQVFLYDIDDLQQVAMANEEQRRRESLVAERIIVEEEENFAGWLLALKAVPTIKHLRARAEQIRSSEIDRFAQRLDLSEAQRESVDSMTRAIVNKLLHPPLARLGAQKDREEGLAVLEEARALFGLDDPDAPGSEIDTEVRLGPGASQSSASPSAEGEEGE